MSARKPILFLLSLSLFLLLAIALPARANNHPEIPLPRGPMELPPEAAPRAQKPFLERFVPVERTHDGESLSGTFGWIGASLGDLDGDGRNGYLIAAPNYQNGTGRIVVYDDDGHIAATHLGNNPNTSFGYSAATAGDVDGDGTDDYIISAPGSSAQGTPGRVVVYSGADHTIIHEISGATSLGTAVTGVGDADGDGYDDFAIGAYRFNGFAGWVGVYSGQSGALLWSQSGNQPPDLLGGGAGRVDDLDGDGHDDLVVSAFGADGFNGRAYVFSAADGSVIYELLPGEPGQWGTFGVFFASGAGDTNADGIGDIFIGDYAALGFQGRAYIYSGADGSILHTFRPEDAADAGVGPGRGIPDVNGDGYDDVIVAAYLSSAGAPEGGKVYVYSGFDGSILHEVTGAVPFDQLGVDALSLGDVDGDGRQEFLLTAPGLSFGGLDVGHNYVIDFNTPPGVLPGP